MKALLQGTLRLAVFTCGLLAGVQIPGYMDQYEARVDAHLLEVTQSISGFQATANLYFAGDLTALIAYYENSGDQVFENDANSIRNIYNRYLRMSREQTLVSAPWYASAIHVLFAADPELRDEALSRFNYTIPLEVEALEWGVAVALLVTLGVELLLLACGGLAGLGRRRKPA